MVLTSNLYHIIQEQAKRRRYFQWSRFNPKTPRFQTDCCRARLALVHVAFCRKKKQYGGGHFKPKILSYTLLHSNRDTSDSKRIFLKSLKDRAPELFKTLHDDEESSWKSPRAYSTPQKPPRIGQIDTFEAPTRLYDTKLIRRGSNSSNDFSETYHTTSHNDDPVRPTVTDTVQSYSRKTVPARNGRGVETIESTEKKSVTKSRYRDPGGYKYYDSDSRARNVQSPVVIEVRNNYRK